MPKRKHTAEEIINKMREAEVVIASGSTVAEASRRIGVSEQTFYLSPVAVRVRWSPGGPGPAP